MKTNTGKMIIKLAGTLLIWFSLIYLYTFLHEGGHALIAIIYGGKIHNFVLGFNAHVSHSGANFTPIGESLFNSAGVLLPAISLAIALKFYNRKVKNLIYHYIYAGISIMITGSFFAWIIIPIISLFTAPPAGDDVSKFLETSGLNPLLISLMAILLMFLLVLIAFKKGLYPKILENLRSLSQVKRTGPTNTKFDKWQSVGLILVLIFVGLFTFACYQILQPDKIFETSFSMNVGDNRKDMKMSFDVKKGKTYKMNLNLESEGMLTDIVIYDDKGNMVYQNVCERLNLSSSLDLNTGNYLFMLTFIRDPEVMVQYFEEKKYTFSREQIEGLEELFEKKRDDKFIPVSFSAVIK